MFRLLSPAFEPDGKIPDVHSRHGEDRSPALSWSGAPQGTRAYALIMHDPDAPGGHFTHWVAYNIPASDPNLPEGVAHRGDLIDGTLQGENDWGEFGYGGPRPPEGDEHRYVFRLYALDSPLSLGPGATEGTVKDAMRGHVLASTLLVGRHMQAA